MYYYYIKGFVQLLKKGQDRKCIFVSKQDFQSLKRGHETQSKPPYFNIRYMHVYTVSRYMKCMRTKALRC